MMKKWQWIVLCLVAYLVFLFVNTPAAIITKFIPADAGINIYKPTGSLFKGRAESISASGIRVDSVTWELSMVKLLIGRASIDVNGGQLRQNDKAYIDGNISVSLFNTNAISASDLSVLVPIKNILAQLDLRVRITTEGRIRVDIEEFSKDDSCEVLQGTGNWNNAQLTVTPQTIELGNFEASLRCSEGNYSALVSGDNRLGLNAEFSITPTGELSKQGTFQLDQSLPREMQDAAQFFGRVDNNGVFTLFP